MAGVRETPKLKRIYKLTLPLTLLARELIEAKTDAELVELAKDVQWMNEYNCYADMFDCKKILAEAIRNEQVKRIQKRQHIQANSNTAR